MAIKYAIPKEIYYNFISCPVISPNTLITIAIKTIIANIFVYFSLLEFNYLQKYPGVLTTFDKKNNFSPECKNLIQIVGCIEGLKKDIVQIK